MRLSTYWQSTLSGEAIGRDPAQGAARLMAGVVPADAQKWATGDPADWAQDSYQIAKTVLYGFAADSAAGKYTFPAAKGEQDSCGEVVLYRVGSDYETKARAAMKEQLAKAGVRLAQALRDSFK